MNRKLYAQLSLQLLKGSLSFKVARDCVDRVYLVDFFPVFSPLTQRFCFDQQHALPALKTCVFVERGRLSEGNCRQVLSPTQATLLWLFPSQSGVSPFGKSKSSSLDSEAEIAMSFQMLRSAWTLCSFLSSFSCA